MSTGGFRPRMSVARCCCPKPSKYDYHCDLVLSAWYGTYKASDYGYYNPLDDSYVVQIYRDQDNGGILYGAWIDGQFVVPGEKKAFSSFFDFPVSIPQGSVITSATIKMGSGVLATPQPRESWNTTNPNLDIPVLPQSLVYAACRAYAYDYDQPDPLPLGATTLDMKALQRTTAFDEYVREHWQGQGTPDLIYSLQVGDRFSDLDVTLPVQEVVNRPGWVGVDNIMRILIDWDETRGPHVPIGIDNEDCGAYASVAWSGNTRPELEVIF